ncbi:uncharacterized protein LOC128737767 isoform X2 [Sabethes cyaneus]|uniref:uncharacterized protein LOC128737767 isoform X2 n=1 Tax=Sabethes cyaneus TaxID=53552 RepID=UPI00237E4D66|nr:uncharacterized protein LOC128737767 isoform X2 [Sabethes cyaneus]
MSSNEKLKASIPRNKTVLLEDLSAVCRTCFIEKPNLDTELYRIDEIFLEENPNNAQVQSFEEILCLFVDDQIGKDNSRMPHSICMSCVEKARAAYQFFEMCRQTDITLREFFLDNEANALEEEDKKTIFTTEAGEKTEYSIEVVVVEDATAQSETNRKR